MTAQRNESHGGNIYQASRSYGIKQEDFLDYSANINPFGLPGSLRETLMANIDQLIHYPDPDCTELKEEISSYLKVDKDSIIIGNGASEVIFLLFDILRPRKVLMPAPTFSEYARASAVSGVETGYLELKEQDDFRLNVQELLSRMDSNMDMIFLCNPNNPTSTLLGREDLLEIVERANKNNVFVVIDEAFIELTPGANKNSVVDLIGDYRNLFIIRAFTKLFAIPGLRLGYGLGDENIVKKMWERKLPWSVNTFACSMGRILSAEKDYMDRTCEWIRQEKEWFYAELFRIADFKVFQPQTNFVLVKILKEGLNSAGLRNKMARKGILIRDASNFKFLDDRFVRFAIKDRESNTRFLSVLKDILQEV